MNIQSSVYGLLALLMLACGAPSEEPAPTPDMVVEDTVPEPVAVPSLVDSFYADYAQTERASVSHGTVGNGSLEDAWLFPFSGDHWSFYDTAAYLDGRAFINSEVMEVVESTYAELGKRYPEREWRLMDCAYREGGKLWPHNTHQNGLSIDFMIPTLKEGQHYQPLDNAGTGHYWLTFDDDGRYVKDTSVTLDFAMVANHLLELHRQAEKRGVRIKKVLLKIALKDDLFATPEGKELKATGIYFAQALEPLIDALHDDHYHVDFEID